VVDIKQCSNCHTVYTASSTCPKCGSSVVSGIQEQQKAEPNTIGPTAINTSFSWLWIIPSIILVPLSLYLVSLDIPWLAIAMAFTAAIFAGIGLSQLLAGRMKWWVMLLIFIGFYLFVRLPVQLSGVSTKESLLILDFINVTIISCIIGIPIVNSHRRKTIME
jgi:hypothetical protein